LAHAQDFVISNETAVPYVEGQCDDSCCVENNPQVIVTRDDPCCNNVSKLIIPFHLSALAKVPTAEIEEIAGETDPVVKILKLLRLIEKCNK
jgi:hypothetical protein